jgi:ABC-type glycerol-3-phosphate transport system substrate-binding protein
MTNTNNQKARAISDALLPTRRGLYQDPNILQQLPIIPRAKAALDSARARPAHPLYSGMSAAMAEQFNLCLTGQVTPVQDARTLQRRLSDILRGP